MEIGFLKKIVSSLWEIKGKTKDNLSSLSDEKLIELFTTDGKNEEIFEEIFNRYANRVYGLAYRISHNQIDAEDILQEVFLTLFKKIDTFKGKASFSTWLYKVTMNASYMHYRAKGKKYESEISLENYAPYDENGTLMGRIKSKDWSDRPDEVLFSREALETIERAVNDLPEPYRVVLYLRDVEDKSSDEVANILGISVGTVKSRLHRARLFLRDKLSDYFYEWQG
jgi:RNA polymerase sigma-70 factor (ECF subfamily)